MKRADFVRHLKKNGCEFMREGSKHSVFWNPENDFISTVPRHTEIDPYLTRKICKDLGIPAPQGR
ncbi:MAG: type II toxin-antitoxin system HicA family toxin [Candidatus Paceibacterota bacterium]|jgi:predicted RNA binding protein YcfA (HicA-like mRNA interferase family)